MSKGDCGSWRLRVPLLVVVGARPAKCRYLPPSSQNQALTFALSPLPWSCAAPWPLRRVFGLPRCVVVGVWGERGSECV